MAYRTPLETRLAKKTTKAITDFNLIEDGDRVMVGLSGGKDSWALIQILDVLRQRAPIRSRSSPSTSTRATKATSTRADREDLRGARLGVPHRAHRHRRGDRRHARRERTRRARSVRGSGAACSYRMATEVGATKIALGHHLDDFIETLLLNLFFAGALKAMPARLVSDNGAHVVIRPLVYVSEDEARAYAKECELPIIGCCCPGVRRPRACSASASKRLIAGARARAPGRQALDAQGARQRHAAPPARSAAESARRRCRARASERDGAMRRNRRPSDSRRRCQPGQAVSLGADGAVARMRAVVQRVTEARVGRRRARRRRDRRGPARAARRRPGTMVRPTSQYIARKSVSCVSSRTSDGKMNRSVADIGRRRARGLAVHAVRRRAQGPPAVVRSRGAAGPCARALRGRRATTCASGPARRPPASSRR